jgi:hypothetical protein
LYNSYFPRLFFFLIFANFIIYVCTSTGKLCNRLVSFAATYAANAVASLGDTALVAAPGDTALVAPLGDALVAAPGDTALVAPLGDALVAPLGDALAVALGDDLVAPFGDIPAAFDDELDDDLRGLLGDNFVLGIYYIYYKKRKK